LDGERHAGAVRVLDESSKRRRVGLLSQAEADQAQPLLSPLYYIRRALQPFADLVEPSSADLADAIPQILDQKPASWTSPQPVTEFPKAGPFADLAPPTEVTVTRQVLAEPTPDIVERTWAALADGTPLVTGLKKGKGTLVLFHVTPEATWSNLPISGSFVEMLRRIVQLSRNQGAAVA
ncbi:MAG: RNA-binding protein, partial [Mesorhizobium sp.]